MEGVFEVLLTPATSGIQDPGTFKGYQRFHQLLKAMPLHHLLCLAIMHLDL